MFFADHFYSTNSDLMSPRAPPMVMVFTPPVLPVEEVGLLDPVNLLGGEGGNLVDEQRSIPLHEEDRQSIFANYGEQLKLCPIKIQGVFENPTIICKHFPPHGNIHC